MQIKLTNLIKEIRTDRHQKAVTPYLRKPVNMNSASIPNANRYAGLTPFVQR